MLSWRTRGVPFSLPTVQRYQIDARVLTLLELIFKYVDIFYLVPIWAHLANILANPAQAQPMWAPVGHAEYVMHHIVCDRIIDNTIKCFGTTVLGVRRSYLFHFHMVN